MENTQEIKEGDWVTPNVELLEKLGMQDTGAYALRGNNYRVVKVINGTLTFIEVDHSHGNTGWISDYWMLSKNQIIYDIIQEL